MKIAILMMQKNEPELLEFWLRYHGYLVGFENLYVYDNGSENEKVLSALAKYKEIGVNIDYTKSKRKDFEGKGRLFLEKIRELQGHSDYDFFIPLDCDEFLAFLDNEGNPSCDYEGLHSILTQYTNKKELLLIDSQFYNSTVSNCWFTKKPYRKCFFYRNTIKELDVGFHWGKVNDSNEEIRTRLIHFHFHNKPFEIGQSHAKEKLRDRVDNFELETLQKYHGAGLHLVRFFTQDEKSYIANQLKQPHFRSNVLAQKLNELGMTWPYTSEMERSISIHEIEVEAEFNKNAVDYFHGSIDYVGFDSKSGIIELKGWAVFQLSQPVSNIYIELDGGQKLPVEINTRFQREDVSTRLGANKTPIGFEANITVGSLHSFCDFNIMALSTFKAEYFKFDINKKYRDVLSV